MGSKSLAAGLLGLWALTMPLVSHADNLEEVIARKAAEQKKILEQQRQEAEAQNARMTQATGLESKLPKAPAVDEVPSSMIPGKEGHYVPYDWKIKQMAEKQNHVLHPVPAPSVEVASPGGVQLKQYRTLAEAAADGVNPLQPKATPESDSKWLSTLLGILAVSLGSFGLYRANRRYNFRALYAKALNRKFHDSDTQ